MLPPAGKSAEAYAPAVLGPDHGDAFAAEGGAIAALERHCGVRLQRGTYDPLAGFLF